MRARKISLLPSINLNSALKGESARRPTLIETGTLYNTTRREKFQIGAETTKYRAFDARS